MSAQPGAARSRGPREAKACTQLGRVQSQSARKIDDQEGWCACAMRMGRRKTAPKYAPTQIE